MAYDPEDPKMEGYVPLDVFRDKDATRSSRRVREDSDVSPVTEGEMKELLETTINADLDIREVGGVGDGDADDTVAFANWIRKCASTGRTGVIPANCVVMVSGQQILEIEGDLSIRCEGWIKNRDGAAATQRMILLDGGGAGKITWKGGHFDANGGAFSCLEIRDWAYADVYLDETTGIVGSAASTGSTSGLVFANVRYGIAGWGTSHDMQQGGATAQGSVPRSFSVSCNDATRSDCAIYPGNDRDIHGLIVIGDMAGGVVDVFHGNALRVHDNGVYNVGDASEVNVYDLRCDDIDEMFVNSGSGILNAYRPILRNATNAIGLQNCPAVNIFDGDLHFADGVNPFKTRHGLNLAAGALRIYRSRVRCNPTGRVVDLGSGTNGTCEEFVDIGNRWEIQVDGATITTPTMFSMVPGARCLVESDSEWIVSDKPGGTLYATDIILAMPTVTELSYWKRAPVSKMASAGLRLAAARQQKFTFSGSFAVGNIQSERETNQADRTTAAPRQVWGTSAPTSGYWPRGSIIWNSAPSAGQPAAWICTVAGSPVDPVTAGTWEPLVLSRLQGAIGYASQNLAAGAFGTESTITVTGAAPGDWVRLAPSVESVGEVWHGYVSAANTVKARPQNITGGPITTAAGTIRARVEKL